MIFEASSRKAKSVIHNLMLQTVDGFPAIIKGTLHIIGPAQGSSGPP
jgi:hypothetical protein